MNSFAFSFPKIFSEFKQSIHLALPLIVTELVYGLNGFIATLMISHLGKSQLAANALVWGMYTTIIVLFIGILNSISILISQSFGAKDKKGIGLAFKQGLILVFLCAIPMMLIMWISPIVLTWTGQDINVIAYAKPFFHILIWTILPLNFVFSIEQFLLGINKPNMVTLLSILQVPITILFNYLFLFGKLGFPKLGLSGIGYSAIIAQCLPILFLIIYFHSSKEIKNYHLFDKWWIINKKFLFELIRVGLPLGFIYFIEVALFTVIAMMMGILGTNVLAAYQLAYQYLMLGLVILFAFAQSSTIRTGNEVGRNDRSALKVTALVNIGIAFLFMLPFSIIYINFPFLALSLDVNINTLNLKLVINQAAVFLSIVGIILIIESFRLVSLGLLRGLKDTKFPIIVSIICFWCIAFPLSYAFAFKLHLNGVGILWGLLIGLCMAAIMLFIRFTYTVKKIDLIKIVTKS